MQYIITLVADIDDGLYQNLKQWGMNDVAIQDRTKRGFGKLPTDALYGTPVCDYEVSDIKLQRV